MAGFAAANRKVPLTGSLGAGLIARRAELGIDQKEAAMMCGVSQPTFQRWEAGRRPDEKYLINIARFLNMELGDVALLRSGIDPEEFIARRIEGVEERADEVARALKLLRPDPPADPA